MFGVTRECLGRNLRISQSPLQVSLFSPLVLFFFFFPHLAHLRNKPCHPECHEMVTQFPQRQEIHRVACDFDAPALGCDQPTYSFKMEDYQD